MKKQKKLHAKKWGHLKKRKIRVLIVFCIVFFSLFDLPKTYQNSALVCKYQPLIVISGSMEPVIGVESLVMIKKVSFHKIKKGDIIAFYSNAVNGEMVVHRVVEVFDDYLITKGDNNQYVDKQRIDVDSYVGKCLFHTRFFSKYWALLKSPQGFIVFCLFPCSIGYMGYLLFKSNKKKDEKDE